VRPNFPEKEACGVLGILMVFELPASDSMRRMHSPPPLLFSYTTIFSIRPLSPWHIMLFSRLTRVLLDLTA